MPKKWVVSLVLLLFQLLLAAPPMHRGNRNDRPLWAGNSLPPGQAIQLRSSRQLHLTFAGFTLTNDAGLTRINMLGTQPTASPFAPELPLIRLALLVPPNTTLHVESILGTTQTFALAALGFADPLPLPAPPATKRPIKLRSPLPCTGSGQWGENATTLLEVAQSAAGRVYLLELYPFSYRFPEHTLLYRENLALNLVCSKNERPGAPVSTATRRLLIAAPESYQPALTTFRAAREAQGWQTDFLPADTDPERLRDRLRQRYHGEPFTHLLLIGNSRQIPPWRGLGTDSPPTDLYYACYDDDSDWLPEVYYGRIPLTEPTHLSEILSRSQPDNRLAFLAAPQEPQWTEECHDGIIYRHLLPRALEPLRLYARNALATQTATLQFLHREDLCMVTYSGHGTRYAWEEPALDRNSVTAAAPATAALIISLACQTGDFSLDNDECLAAAWLKAGAAGIIAASGDTYWAEDACLENGLFDACFDQQATTVGEALLLAKLHYLAVYGDSPNTRQYWEQYHLLGDPSQPLPAWSGLSLPPPVKVSRQLSPAETTSTTAVTVTLDIAFAGTLPKACILAEHLPPGWSLSAPYWNGKPITAEQDQPGYARFLFGWNLPVSAGQLTYTATPETPNVTAPLLFSGTLTTPDAVYPITGDLLLNLQRRWNTLEIALPHGWSFHALPCLPVRLPPEGQLFAVDGTCLPVDQLQPGQPFWLFNPGAPLQWLPGGYSDNLSTLFHYSLNQGWTALGLAGETAAPFDLPTGTAFIRDSQNWTPLHTPLQPGQGCLFRPVRH